MAVVMSARKKTAFIVDMPRGLPKANLQELYAAVETVKNGFAYDKRYRYRQTRFDRPQIVAFANRTPHFELLSEDRWAVYNMLPNFTLEELSIPEAIALQRRLDRQALDAEIAGPAAAAAPVAAANVAAAPGAPPADGAPAAAPAAGEGAGEVSQDSVVEVPFWCPHPMEVARLWAIECGIIPAVPAGPPVAAPAAPPLPAPGLDVDEADFVPGAEEEPVGDAFAVPAVVELDEPIVEEFRFD